MPFLKLWVVEPKELTLTAMPVHQGCIGGHLKRSNNGSLLVSFTPLGVLSWMLTLKVDNYVIGRLDWSLKLRIFIQAFDLLLVYLVKRVLFNQGFFL